VAGLFELCKGVEGLLNEPKSSPAPRDIRRLRGLVDQIGSAGSWKVKSLIFLRGTNTSVFFSEVGVESNKEMLLLAILRFLLTDIFETVRDERMCCFDEDNGFKDGSLSPLDSSLRSDPASFGTSPKGDWIPAVGIDEIGITGVAGVGRALITGTVGV